MCEDRDGARVVLLALPATVVAPGDTCMQLPHGLWYDRACTDHLRHADSRGARAVRARFHHVPRRETEGCARVAVTDIREFAPAVTIEAQNGRLCKSCGC